MGSPFHNRDVRKRWRRSLRSASTPTMAQPFVAAVERRGSSSRADSKLADVQTCCGAVSGASTIAAPRQVRGLCPVANSACRGAYRHIKTSSLLCRLRGCSGYCNWSTDMHAYNARRHSLPCLCTSTQACGIQNLHSVKILSRACICAAELLLAVQCPAGLAVVDTRHWRLVTWR
jgi:hypothetical protein